jgi:hypothetical protein
MSWLCKTIAMLTVLLTAYSSDARQEQGAPPENSLSALTNTPVRLVQDGIYEIGAVRLDQRKRTVTFPAELNKSEGLMEYFLVTSYGKTHESILKTKARPYDIHLAMLLLGVHAPGTTNGTGEGLGGPVVHPSRDQLPGDKIEISVKWKAGKDEAQHSVAEMIYKKDVRKLMEQGGWIYNGSVMAHNKFLAQSEGSIISLVTDRTALVNNMGPGHDNDLIWEPNATNLPPASAMVEVTMSIPEAAKHD